VFNAIRNIVSLAAIVCVTLTVPVYGAETAGEYIDDATVATKVKAALLNNEVSSALSINVEVYKGIVQLSGFVDSEAQKAAAMASAGKVEGTKQVLDAIVVLSGSRSMGETVDDTTIHVKLKTELAKVEGFSNAVAINTAVRQGDVLLAGFVADLKVKSAAEEVAKGITGVKEVHNFIAVQP
jgi:hyperosmotically inducible protein